MYLFKCKFVFVKILKCISVNSSVRPWMGGIVLLSPSLSSSHPLTSHAPCHCPYLQDLPPHLQHQEQQRINNVDQHRKKILKAQFTKTSNLTLAIIHLSISTSPIIPLIIHITEINKAQLISLIIPDFQIIQSTRVTRSRPTFSKQTKATGLIIPAFNITPSTLSPHPSSSSCCINSSHRSTTTSKGFKPPSIYNVYTNL